MTIFEILSIIVAAICIVVMFIVIFVEKRRDYKLVGTMHIDMTRSDKDICLFTLDIPLNDIAGYQYVLMKVDGKSQLKEWKTE